ncbi:glycosyl hydrolase family protein [Flaviaesturariibacter flavus]|uniref:Glycosyl hydrolase family protein n=1 Tax=Flaviaesturariibacter flavus TaxID=2502780 RepID=A0A4R1BB95_9BACT|nr:family 16 glycosylhydrolase [Flaviaesturariibacter flavus]TCJ14243.1 glycosyl hydrolase family protein [Flaviaesturariibacter flavus]
MKMIPFSALLLLAVACNKGGSSGGDTPAQQARISIEDLALAEGNGGSTEFAFRVLLENAPSGNVTVQYGTQDGTARSGEDFTAVSGATLTFAPGETEKRIRISVTADDIREGDDQFKVVLANASGAVITRSSATGQIINDDTRVPFTNAGYDAPTSYPGYTLAWSDEFNGPSLNTTDWKNQNGDGCPGLCGWGNNELEYYTDRPENLFFQDGKLVIEARKEDYSGKAYTSSKILTEGKKTFKFGRIDIRARLPKGKGIWPALWLLPQDNVYGGWPRSGEIDLMELVGHEPNKVYGTLHYGPGPGSTQTSRGYTLPSGNFNDEFHVFSLEWKQDQIKWYVDNNLYSTVNRADIGALNWPFNERFYLIFNLAVGGNWPGNPDASTYLPQWMIVDYIRVYQ